MRTWCLSGGGLGRSLSDPLDHPVLLAQRAAVVLLDPQRHAAVVEGVVALAPDHCRETKVGEGVEKKEISGREGAGHQILHNIKTFWALGHLLEKCCSSRVARSAVSLW